MKALVIVHLSSLDAYAEYGGVRSAHDLAMRLKDAILAWDGPIYIIDQRWPLTEFSGPRWNLVMSVQLQKDINWRHFDDRSDEWEIFVRRLRTDLIREGIKSIVLGGVWYDPEEEGGCVTDVQRSFKKYFKVKVDKDLVGCWSKAREKLGTF